MTDKNIKRVSDISVKAVKDETNWEQVYSQTEASTLQKIDKEFPELKHVIYRKSQPKS
jgi:flagellar hook-associated protein FlgK